MDLIVGILLLVGIPFITLGVFALLTGKAYKFDGPPGYLGDEWSWPTNFVSVSGPEARMIGFGYLLVGISCLTFWCFFEDILDLLGIPYQHIGNFFDPEGNVRKYQQK